MSQPYRNVTGIIVRGGAQVRLMPDGFIHGASTAFCRDDHTLVLVGNQGGSVGSSTLDDVYESYVTAQCSASIIDNIVHVRCPPAGYIVINGHRRAVAEILRGNVRPEPERVFRLHVPSCVLSNIRIENGSLADFTGDLIDESLKLIVQGTTKFNLFGRCNGQPYKNLEIQVEGTASVECSVAARALHATINVSGNGKVDGLMFMDKGNIKVTGSGKVFVYAQRPERVTSQCTGSGSITVLQRTSLPIYPNLTAAAAAAATMTAFSATTDTNNVAAVDTTTTEHSHVSSSSTTAGVPGRNIVTGNISVDGNFHVGDIVAATTNKRKTETSTATTPSKRKKNKTSIK